MTPNEFKAAMEELGLTREGMAYHLQVTTATIDNWRSGRTAITPVKAMAIKYLLEMQKKEASNG